MSDETVTIVDRNHALPWDTDVFNVAVTTGAGGVAVLTSSTSCGYSNNDVESIAIPWPDVLKHAPLGALVDALKARPDTVVYQPTGETFVELSPIPPLPEGVDGVRSRATSAGAEDLLIIVRRVNQ